MPEAFNTNGGPLLNHKRLSTLPVDHYWTTRGSQHYRWTTTGPQEALNITGGPLLDHKRLSTLLVDHYWTTRGSQHYWWTTTGPQETLNTTGGPLLDHKRLSTLLVDHYWTTRDSQHYWWTTTGPQEALNTTGGPLLDHKRLSTLLVDHYWTTTLIMDHSGPQDSRNTNKDFNFSFQQLIRNNYNTTSQHTNPVTRKGLLIEANPSAFQQLLSKHRKAWAINAAAAVNTYTSIVSYLSTGDKEEAGEISEDLHIGIKIKAIPLYSILKSMDRVIDFLSLDIQGQELKVLQTLPWNIVKIRVMCIRAERQELLSLNGLLINNGYKFLTAMNNHSWYKWDKVWFMDADEEHEEIKPGHM
ncbi:Star-like 7 [Homarus americanus]|uniref:Star-like 7 n=1 Tax=Homarus americanus TaxID=6706 RepID=A0A8J5N7Z2_HOMAM|nr:Star-like 7 [Homarus americanus]